MNFYFYFIFWLIYTICAAESYKILMFSPTLTKSHMMSCARIADTLAKDGHNVTLLEVEYFEPPHSFNTSKLAKVLKVPGKHIESEHVEEFIGITTIKAFDPFSIYSLYKVNTFFMDIMNEACERFLANEAALIAKLKAEKFDAYFGEQLTLCGSGLSHLLEIPIHILISSCPIQEHVSSLLGLPHPANYVPSVEELDVSDRMSLSERIQNQLAIWINVYTYNYYGSRILTNIFRAKYGSSFPNLLDIAKTSPFVFVNVDEFVDFPRPLFSNIVYIGGLGQSKSDVTALQEPFKSEMEKGEKGVVLFSLGSAVNTEFLDEIFIRNLFGSFANLSDYHFIVKIDENDKVSKEICKQILNVFLTSWAPQTALLAHPRLKLFITHGGYNSLLEVAQNGVPVISMGFFADQYRNGRVAERNGWGRSFHKNLLLSGSKEFHATILDVLNNPSYKKNAIRTSKLLKTKPFSAEELLIKNIRFLEMNDGKLPELLSESRNMNAIVYNNLDLILLAVVTLSTLLIVLIISLKIISHVIARLVKNGLFTTEKIKAE